MTLDQLFLKRHEILADLKEKPWCDVLVIGGGIHGASVAHLAAFNGLRTVLLEARDYAVGSSSRSSRLIHGGLRYLEFLDLRQVWWGLKAREQWYRIAPHLVHAYPFSVPLTQLTAVTRLKTRLGVFLYRRIARLVRGALEEMKLDGTHAEAMYSDGIMSDTRLVFEKIMAARQEGAHCLNYARVSRVLTMKDEDKLLVHWVDGSRTGQGRAHRLEAGVVLNCAGAWVPQISAPQTGTLKACQRMSQGTHLLFEREWTKPAQVFPIKGARARYYFVLPHTQGTWVGTTEREISKNPEEPFPDSSEVTELLARLSSDLPDAGLSRTNLVYACAGIRSLAAQPSRWREVSRVSRKHRWIALNGVFHLLGGKFTTAPLEALEGLRLVYRLAQRGEAPADVRDRMLPGAANYEQECSTFRSEALRRGVAEELINGAIQRWGSRVRYLLANQDYLESVGGLLLRGEIALAVLLEQAETLEDIMCRRLELHFRRDRGMVVLEEVLSLLQQFHPQLNANAEREAYRAWAARLEELFTQV